MGQIGFFGRYTGLDARPLAKIDRLFRGKTSAVCDKARKSRAGRKVGRGGDARRSF